MSRDERFEIVIVGGGPNGMTTAAYLAKCGLRVCVLEERTECAAPVRPGADPGRAHLPARHAHVRLAGARITSSSSCTGMASGWSGTLRTRSRRAPAARLHRWLAVPTDRDKLGWAKIGGLLGSPPFTRELMRAAFWCPPHPPKWR